ncbi:MAG: nucleoside monophosphate kinase [Alphaproteobacteria bacterium]|jgi:adenylate kinase|nr:nucleoside monophosphate kinase [Alphaproteobacteria bacterium]MCV6599563.1 nucleoside monophosphate kinase [Alphaproteobacteria bacterium]
MKNVVLFGAPGAGKGTVAKYLADRYGWKHLSTGHVFRSDFYNRPEFKDLKEALEQGKFASNDIVIKLVEEWLDKVGVKGGIIFDGFPRDLDQAKAFEEIIKKRGLDIDFIISLDVSDEEIINRITGRINCPSCGSSFHETANPPKKEGVCDFCGSEDLCKREEDTEEALKERMMRYHTRTNPVIEYYKDLHTVSVIDASGTPEEVQSIVRDIIGKE